MLLENFKFHATYLILSAARISYCGPYINFRKYIFPVSNSVSPFAEAERLFRRKEPFCSATYYNSTEKEPFDARENAFPEKCLNRFTRMVVIRCFSSDEFKKRET